MILFEGRTGSTHLAELLQSHSRIESKGEHLSYLRSKGLSSPQVLRWASSYLRSRPALRAGARGFKTKLRDVSDPTGFARVVEHRRPVTIHLMRRNSLKHAISRLNSRRLRAATGQFNLYPGTQDLPPLHVDLAALDEQLLERSTHDHRLAEFCRGLSVPVEQVAYEDLLNDESAVLLRIFELLGVPYEAVSSPVRKVTSDDLRHALANYDEVRAHVAGTEYEPMLDA